MRWILFNTVLLVIFSISESIAATSTPQFFQSGLGAPLLTDPPSWDFTVPRQASRTEGVAPLSVFFSAGLTPSSPTERSFHNYEYSWNFGDSTSGNWGTNGNSKNKDKGAVASHVYETPGTYTVTLTVRNLTGFIDTDTFTITVTDPDTVFAGTNTTCISSNAHNDFTGCPAGARQTTTDDLKTALETYATSNHRVLLHRGSAWTITAGVNFPNATTVSIGAYGNGTNEDGFGIYGNAPHITTNGVNVFADLAGKIDWRLTDLKFTGPKTDYAVVSGGREKSNVLIMRLDTTGYGTPIGWGHWRTSESDISKNMFVVSCRIRNTSGMSTYFGAENFAVMGNEIKNSDTTHMSRVWWMYKGVYKHNYLSGSSLTNTAARHALKFHGPAYYSGTEDIAQKTYKGDFATTGAVGMPEFTKFAIISDNIIGSSGYTPVYAGPQDAVTDERLSDILFERNKYIMQYGDSSSTVVSNAYIFSGRFMTVRNNITDLSGGNPWMAGIAVDHRGVEWTPEYIEIYNNTVYCAVGGGANQQASGVKIHADANNVTVKNNLISFPVAINEVIIDNSGTATISHNIVTDTPHFVDPDNATPLDRDFSLTQNSLEAINKGTTVPVLDDFLQTERTGTIDIGAYSY